MISSRKYKTKKNKTRRIKKTDAYVINLDKATERWNQIQKDFKNTNLNLIRTSAVKHKDGCTGLLFSFKNIIRTAKENNLETVLILEDDAFPTENFNKRWSKTKKWLDENMDKWEVFNGGARIYSAEQRKTKIFIKLNDDINIFIFCSCHQFIYIKL